MRTWLRLWEGWRPARPSLITRPSTVRARSVERPMGASLWGVALVVLTLAGIFGPALVAHMRLSADPLALNDDARQQIYPFLSYFQRGLFPNDYPARYYFACFPIGFRAFYTLLAYVVDPIAVSKVVPYLLLAVLLVALGAASYRLSGLIGCWFTLAFALSSPYFLARLTGGLPRGFGLALLGCVLAALVLGRMRLLAVLTVLSAAFYAPAAVLGGLCLGAIVLVFPADSRGDTATWSLRRRVALVLLTMAGCVMVLLPTLLGSRAYGVTLGPSDVAAYPELGPNGRYGPEDRAPFDALPTAMLKMLPEAFRGKETEWLPGKYDWIASIPGNLGRMPLLQWVMLATGVVLIVGLLLKARRDDSAQRLLVLLAVAAVAYVVSAPLAPTFYLPQRYTAYTIPLIAVVGLPAASGALASVVRARGVRRWLAPLMTVAVCGGILVYTGGTGNRSAGLTRFGDASAPIYQFVASTPPDTLFAAWPSELANNLPYFSHRSVLINQEIHQVFHQRYADEMRARMNALIDAYLATDIEPIRQLRDHYGVRYLIVDQRHVSGNVPLYFAPYNERIENAVQMLKRSGGTSMLQRLASDATVFRDGPLVVVDLARIGQP